MQWRAGSRRLSGSPVDDRCQMLCGMPSKLAAVSFYLNDYSSRDLRHLEQFLTGAWKIGIEIQ